MTNNLMVVLRDAVARITAAREELEAGAIREAAAILLDLELDLAAALASEVLASW
jgi:hypothetical protein